MAIDALPTELLDDIFRQCNYDDISALKLTNRYLHNAAASHFPKEFVVCYNKQSLERAASIGSKHEKFAKNVESLWFRGERLRVYKSMEQWKEHSGRLDSTIAAKIRKYKVDPAKVQLAYFNYTRLLCDQDEMDKSEAVLTSLSAFFKACPKLSQLWINIPQHMRRPTASRKQAFQRGLVAPSESAGPDDIEQVLLAAADARRRIDDLFIGQLSLDFLELIDYWTDGIPWLMSGLKKLQLGLDMSSSDRHAIILRRGKVMSFLRPAMELRVLILVLDVLIDIEQVFGDLNFPGLEHLSIKFGQVDMAYLSDLLLRHKHSLIHLHLRNLDISSMNQEWFGFFQSIDCKLPKLRDLKIRGIYDLGIDGERYFSRSWTSKSRGSLEKESPSYIEDEISKLHLHDDEFTVTCSSDNDPEEEAIEFLGESEYPWRDENRD